MSIKGIPRKQSNRKVFMNQKLTIGLAGKDITPEINNISPDVSTDSPIVLFNLFDLPYIVYHS